MKKHQMTVLLSDHEDQVLREIAGDLGCVATHGKTAGEPSWRTLLHHIASGFIVCSSNIKTHRAPAQKKKKRGFIFHKNSPPKWWDKDAKMMDLAIVMKKTGASVDEINATGGLEVHGNDVVIAMPNWPAWRNDEPEPVYTRGHPLHVPTDEEEEEEENYKTPAQMFAELD